MSVIQIGLNLLALVSSFIYFASGYRKESAVYFKGFLYIYTAANLLNAVYSAALGKGYLFITILNFGVLCILAAAADLGKKKSGILCGFSLFLHLLFEILFGISFGISFGFRYTGAVACNILIGILLCFMMYAKYADKKSRNAK